MKLAIIVQFNKVDDKVTKNKRYDLKFAIPEDSEMRTQTFMANDIAKCNRNLRYWCSRLFGKTYKDPSAKLEFMTLFQGKSEVEAKKVVDKLQLAQHNEMIADFKAAIKPDIKDNLTFYVAITQYKYKDALGVSRTSINYSPSLTDDDETADDSDSVVDESDLELK